MTIRDRLLSGLGKALGYNIKTSSKAVLLEPYGVRNALPSLANTLTADRLHGILSAAERKQPRDLFRLYSDVIFRDSHIHSEFAKRLIAVSGDPDILTAADDSPEAERLKDQFQIVLRGLGVKFIHLKLHLLKSSFWPVAVSEIFYQPSFRPGGLYDIAGFKSVDATLLKYDDQDGMMRIGTGDVLDPVYVLPSPDSYIIHRGHVMADEPDYLGGPARALLFWYLFKTFGRDWWIEFLERWGQPFLKGTYDPNDQEGKYLLSRAFESAKRLFGITVSQGTNVEVIQVASQGADAFEKFHAVACAEISKLIVGQTTSSTATNVGLGGGQSTVHEAVRQDYRQFDALLLSHTIRDQVFKPLARLNGWPEDLCPEISFGGGISDAERKSFADILDVASRAGLEVDDDGIPIVSEKIGVPLRRKEVQASPGFPFSATVPQPSERPFSTAAASRAAATIRAEAEQAMTAVDDICAASLDPYRKAMGQQYKPIMRALSASSSRADFLARLDNLNLSVSPDAVAALEQAMTAGAVNAVLQLNNRLRR